MAPSVSQLILVPSVAIWNVVSSALALPSAATVELILAFAPNLVLRPFWQFVLSPLQVTNQVGKGVFIPGGSFQGPPPPPELLSPGLAPKLGSGVVNRPT